MKIQLGDEVKEIVTGFTGIAVTRLSWLSGCDMIRIQPPKNKKDELPEARDFDEPLLSIIKKQKVKIKKEEDGKKKDSVGGSPSFHAIKSNY